MPVDSERDEQSAIAPILTGSSPPIPRDQWKMLSADANPSQVPNVYDGPRTTRWSTTTGSPNTTPLPRHFILDLGKSWTVDRMVIDNDWQGCGEYNVGLSDNPEKFEPVLASMMTNTRPSAFEFSPPLTGRYLFFEVLKGYGSSGVVPTFAYLSELTLEGVEYVEPQPDAKRCHTEPLTINWEYPADAELLIDKFQLWHRDDPAATPIAKVDIDKSKRSVTFPVLFERATAAYYSMIVTGKNSVGVIWESNESNQLWVQRDPSRPWCQDKPQKPPVIGIGPDPIATRDVS